MIVVRKLSYDLKENPELAFTRLLWAVEPVDNLFGQLITNATVATTKPWVGVLEKDLLEFGLIEPRGSFSIRMFQFTIIVEGKINQIEGGSRVDAKLKLSWDATLGLFLIYALSILIAYKVIADGELTDLFSFIVFVIVFPVLGTILLNNRLSRIEQKVKDLFEVI